MFSYKGIGKADLPDHPEVTFIGKKALEILETRISGRVTGITYHGVFLDFGGWVIFLSTEFSRGPLTLNLDSGWQHLNSIEPGLACSVIGHAIHFSKIDLILNTAPAGIWEAPSPPDHILNATGRQAHLVKIAAGILKQDPEGGIHQLLIPLLKHSLARWDTNLSPAAFDVFGRVQQALVTNDPGKIAPSMEPFLGWGTGLTPSGDDLVSGLLLALQRWGKLLYPSLEVQALVAALLPIAYQKTTTLSANLIECAGKGQSDERLLAALDGIMTGLPGPGACIKALTSWGNSSGGDALVGMSLVLQEGFSRLIQ